MSFKKKIDMILEARKLQRLTKNKIEKLINVDGTIYKAYDDDREPADSEIVRKLIGKLGVRQQWWDKDWETGSTDIFEENSTPVQNEATVAENPLGDNPNKLMKALMELEQMGDYRFVPKTVLEGEYRLILDRDITFRIQMVNSIIDGKNETIRTQGGTIDDLRARLEKAEKERDELKAQLLSKQNGKK